MPSFGRLSEERLATVHPDLAAVCRDAIEIVDFRVLEGHRGEEAQNLAYSTGKSRKRWPDGKHNRLPSLAVDVAPYPIDWHDVGRFQFLAGVMFACAHLRGLRLRWGGNWQTLKDYPHFELVEEP